MNGESRAVTATAAANAQRAALLAAAPAPAPSSALPPHLLTGADPYAGFSIRGAAAATMTTQQQQQQQQNAAPRRKFANVPPHLAHWTDEQLERLAKGKAKARIVADRFVRERKEKEAEQSAAEADAEMKELE